jgi:diaminohydroxyphosphoribosylaminopyrimidine deaminase/5-amino-6-(5-phosphoribosylamino)uracil reductase
VPALTDLDRQYLARALELAARGLATTDPNPRVGCVIARGDRIVAEGWHGRAGEPHAEIMALRAAKEDVRGATVYVNLEPCSHHGRTPPCADALIAAGVERVVCSMVDPNPLVMGAGIARLRSAGIAVDMGPPDTEAADLNCGFVQRMKNGRPFVRLKLAASLDGRTALSTGESRWISGDDSRADVQHWRARSSVILTGVATVLHDNPRLDVRVGDQPRQPLRVILDSVLRTPVDARVLDPPGETLIFTAATNAANRASLEKKGVRIETVPRAGAGIDLLAVLKRLAQLQANEIWVEAGARLAGAFVQARLIDELVVYVAPHVLGSTARGMFDLPEPASLAARQGFEFRDVRRIGEDVRLVARSVAPPQATATGPAS